MRASETSKLSMLVLGGPPLQLSASAEPKFYQPPQLPHVQIDVLCHPLRS